MANRSKHGRHNSQSAHMNSKRLMQLGYVRPTLGKQAVKLGLTSPAWKLLFRLRVITELSEEFHFLTSRRSV